MTNNFVFCYDGFMKFLSAGSLFGNNAAKLYNQFLVEKSTVNLIDLIGAHGNIRVDFKYHDEKRIRATFITLEDAKEELDVSCICVLFNGDRRDYYCYFYELYEDGTVGCIEVAHNGDVRRIVRELNVGTDVDRYFEKLCANIKENGNGEIAMLYYLEHDGAFRILDMGADDELRRAMMLGEEPVTETVTKDGVEFELFKATANSTFFAARRVGGKLESIKLEDIERFKK